jgi:general secretion pathway protein H
MVSRAATTPLATGTSTINRGVARTAADTPAASRRSRHAGFTLLEILVVVMIIGILTAGMLLSMNFAGRDTALETESKRLVSLMNYARDQAELQTRDFGIVFGQYGYEFVVYDVRTGAWRTVDEDDALRERTLPSGLDFQLVVDARPIVLDESVKQPPAAAPSDSSSDSSDSTDSTDSTPTPQSHPSVPHVSSASDSDSNSSSDSDTDSDSNANATAFAPQVMIFSSGDLSSFKITLERPSEGHSVTLAANKDGDIVAKPMVGAGK